MHPVARSTAQVTACAVEVDSRRWSTEQHQRLLGALSGLWAQDRWHFNAPRAASGHSLDIHVRFTCRSPTLNGELKYVMWRKFTNGTWAAPMTRRNRAS